MCSRAFVSRVYDQATGAAWAKLDSRREQIFPLLFSFLTAWEFKCRCSWRLAHRYPAHGINRLGSLFFPSRRFRTEVLRGSNGSTSDQHRAVGVVEEKSRQAQKRQRDRAKQVSLYGEEAMSVAGSEIGGCDEILSRYVGDIATYSNVIKERNS